MKNMPLRSFGEARKRMPLEEMINLKRQKVADLDRENECAQLSTDPDEIHLSATSSEESQASSQELYFECAYEEIMNLAHTSWNKRGIIILVPGKRCELLDFISKESVGTLETQITEFCPGIQLIFGQKIANHIKKTSLEPAYSSEGSEPSDSSEGNEDLILMKRPDEKHQMKHKKEDYHVVDVHINPKLAEKLRPHQVEGVKFLYDSVIENRSLFDIHAMINEEESNPDKIPTSAGAILADEMGLGKTLQTIALIDMLFNQSCYVEDENIQCGTIKRVLIICPLSLMRNWKYEFEKWLKDSSLIKVVEDNDKKTINQVLNKKYKVVIMNYEKARSHTFDIRTAQNKFDLLVCDEAHKIKNRKSNVSSALGNLEINRVILLTGTPVQNSLNDFYTMINLIAPNYLGGYSFFKSTFLDPITKSRNKFVNHNIKLSAKERLSLLQQATAPLIFGRQASILADLLPKKHRFVIFCNPSVKQREIYDALIDGDEDTGNGILNTIKKSGRAGVEGLILLRQLCDGPDILIKNLQGRGIHGRTTREVFKYMNKSNLLDDNETNNPEDSGKLCLLMKLLKAFREKTNDKVILASNFKMVLDSFETIFNKVGYTYLRLDGSRKEAGRIDTINEFNNSSVEDNFILLLSTKVGSTGFNLIGANRCILYDGDWNPATDAQMMARIHREGQLKDCFIYQLVLAGTIDEKVFQRQVSKIGLIDAVLNKTEILADDYYDSILRRTFHYDAETLCMSHSDCGCECDATFTRMNSIRHGPLNRQCNLSLSEQEQRQLGPLREWDHFNLNTSNNVPEHFEILKEIVEQNPYARNIVMPSTSNRASGEPLFVFYDGRDCQTVNQNESDV